MLVYSDNFSIWEAEVGEPQVQNQPFAQQSTK